MRLQRLDLERFGHFTDKTLDFGERSDRVSDFHLIYGSNEAGKTTIMEGYLRFLYGFLTREPYAFRHARSTLKISGSLMLGNTVRELSRLPTRNNNLIDQAGTALPETILTSELSGLSIDVYRKLLCLDDATIEDGGDEIANSKGDIGQLLFSAAAGVNDLSELLDKVDKNAGELYRKGRGNTEFALLRAQLAESSTKITESDISLPVYLSRKQNLEAAEAAEIEVKEKRRKRLSRKALLEAVAKALPIYAELADQERELEPLGIFPKSLDIDPEGLIEISTRRVLLEAELNRLKDFIHDKRKSRDAISSQPEKIQALTMLNDMRELRARCGTATTDLPQYQNRNDGVIKDMQRSLADIGLGSSDETAQYVLNPTTLSQMEKKFYDVTVLEAKLDSTNDEESNALQKLELAKNILGQLPTVAEYRKDLRTILDAHDASSLLAEASKSKEALRLAQRSACDALSKLTGSGISFETVPELAMSSEEATKLAGDMEAARAAIVGAEDDVSDSVAKVEQFVSLIDAFTESSAIITDEEAGASRNKRDKLWHDHLSNMSNPSAALFESAMRLDDTMGVVRHGQVKELAEVRQLNASLSDAKSKFQAKKTALETSNTRLAKLQSNLEGFVSTVGLRKDISAYGFADWIRKAETAQECTTIAKNEEIASAPALGEAESLRKKLATALNVPDGKLETVVSLAEKAVAEYEKVQIELRAARNSVESATAEHQKRSERRAQTAESLDAASKAWFQTLASTFGDAGEKIQFPQAFDTLREIRELNEKRLGILNQIESMEMDLRTLEGKMRPLIENNPEVKTTYSIAAYDMLVSKVEAAYKAEESKASLAIEVEDAKKKLETVQNELDDLSAKVQLSAAIFSSDIPTGSVEELRSAVLQTKRAIDIRDRVGKSWSELYSSLGVTTRSEVENELDLHNLPEIRAEMSEISRDLEDLECSVTTAIEIRAHAKMELDAINGDADVAALVSQRQTIELEMESVILKCLKLRLGHILAEKAILRYRDKHRSGMMQAAEAAFSKLTNNAYAGLTTQTNGTKESLIAIMSDGAAKEAHAMSKGTRFQLYLALRAAAYEHMAENGTVLPFFCDDVFETFDDERTRAACGMMHRIGQTGQAIYLTHHQHVVDIAREVCGKDVRVHEI